MKLQLESLVNASGDAGALVTLKTDTSTAQTYEVRATLLYGTCNIGANDISAQIVTVDFGSTDKRVVGGGWIANSYSDNGKGTFGFEVGYSTKTKTTLQGNSVFMLHSVLDQNGRRFNWKVKDTAWSGGTLTFYHNPSISGTTVDSARFTFKGVVQQLDGNTSIGGASIVVDVFDGDLYSPTKKDMYSIKVYDGNNTLWWGSSTSLLPLGGDLIKPGGGNIKVFNK